MLKEIPNMRVVVLNLLDGDNGRKQRIKIADIFASSLFSLLFFPLFWTTTEVARKRCLSLLLWRTHVGVWIEQMWSISVYLSFKIFLALQIHFQKRFVHTAAKTAKRVFQHITGSMCFRAKNQTDKAQTEQMMSIIQLRKK